MRIESITYDTPIKVNRQEYDYLVGTDTQRGAYAGTIVGRKDSRGQCFIKVWYKSVRAPIKKYLNRNEKVT